MDIIERKKMIIVLSFNKLNSKAIFGTFLKETHLTGLSFEEFKLVKIKHLFFATDKTELDIVLYLLEFLE